MLQAREYSGMQCTSVIGVYRLGTWDTLTATFVGPAPMDLAMLLDSPTSKLKQAALVEETALVDFDGDEGTPPVDRVGTVTLIVEPNGPVTTLKIKCKFVGSKDFGLADLVRLYRTRGTVRLTPPQQDMGLDDLDEDPVT